MLTDLGLTQIETVREDKVKTNFLNSLVMAFVVGLVSIMSGVVSAQQNAGRICVLDVAKVFKDNPGFQSQMEGIRAEATRLKSTVESQLNELQEEAKQLDQFQPNSDKRRELERDLVTKQADIQTRARQAEADLLTREAKIYLETYREMEQVVAKIAEENNISLVLRYESQPINQDDRADVIKGVNRQVVYQKYSDLTNLVHTQMVGSAQAPAAQTPSEVQR
jgi:Skp family chaperone for outer membrane proteins